MAATESTFEAPLAGDENNWVLGAITCCFDELQTIPATGWCWTFDPTAEPPGNGKDLAGEPPKASRIESSKSSNALFGAADWSAPCAGDELREPFAFGGGGRAGGPAALTWPLLALSPANSDCCVSTCVTSSVKNGLSSLPPAACG